MPRVQRDSTQRSDCRSCWGIAGSLDSISRVAKSQGSEIELNGTVAGIIGLPWVLAWTRLSSPNSILPILVTK